MKVTQNGEKAAFMRKVALGQYFQTIDDIDDGFGGKKTGAFREYTLPRDHDDSDPVGWIRGFTKIGLVIRVRATYYSEQYGIEIQVKSMLNYGSLFWIVMSRGPNRYVDEVYEEKEEPSHDKGMSSGTSIENSIAGQENPFKIDFRKEYRIEQYLKIEDARPGSKSWRTLSKLIPGRSH